MRRLRPGPSQCLLSEVFLFHRSRLAASPLKSGCSSPHSPVPHMPGLLAAGSKVAGRLTGTVAASFAPISCSHVCELKHEIGDAENTARPREV